MEKVVLFDGTNLDRFTGSDGKPPVWEVKDGIMTVTKGDIISKENFTDAFIHVEFRTPYMPEATGQGRGNSGVIIQGRYEIQVLDSYGYDIPGKGDCGAVYDMHAPLTNACYKPLEWQSYDIAFRSPRFNDKGEITEFARATVFQNNIIIQNNVEIKHPTVILNFKEIDPDLTKPGPLLLQDHGNKVQYRNVWLIHLPFKGSDTYEPHSSK